MAILRDTPNGQRVLRETGDQPTLLRDLPSGERPRERLRDSGPSALSNAELLAILLRTGTKDENVLALASRLIGQAGGLEGLSRVSHAELCSLRGFGEAKASQLLAALELGKRCASFIRDDKPAIHTPEDVANLVQAEMAAFEQEHFRVIVLNTKNRVLAQRDVFVGSVNATKIRMAEVFREAVHQNASKVIVVHNHPSGDPAPSEGDIAVTKELMQAAATLDIELVDHVVVGREGHVSMQDLGVFDSKESSPQAPKSSSRY